MTDAVLRKVEVVQVIKVTAARGDGKSTIMREVAQFWDFDGNLLAENDPCAGKGHSRRVRRSRHTKLRRASAAGYVRVSTLRQASEGDSLASQRNQLAGYAQMKSMALDNIVVEDGVSGAVPLHERPKGGPLFDLLQSGDIVIAAKLDRLFRSALDALTVTDDLKKRGVGVHLLDLGGDIAGNGLSKLFLTIAAAFAEAERDRIRERIGQAKKWQREKGEFMGGTKPPLGFRRVAGSKLLEVDEEGQRALLYIYIYKESPQERLVPRKDH